MSFRQADSDVEISSKEVTAADQKRSWSMPSPAIKILDPLLFFQSVTDEARVSPDRHVMDAAMRSVLGGSSFIDVVKEKREELCADRQRWNGEVKSFGIEIVDAAQARDLPQANSQAIYERYETEREREAAEITRRQRQSKRIKATADRGVTVLSRKRTGFGTDARVKAMPSVTHLCGGVSKDRILRLLSVDAGLEEGRNRHDTRLVFRRTRVSSTSQPERAGSVQRVPMPRQKPAPSPASRKRRDE